LCPSSDPERIRKQAGFTLVEALVALAVVAASLAAIGSLVASSVRAAKTIDQRLALAQTARAIVTALPDRGQLVSGKLGGAIADHRWRVDVLPFAASFVDSGRPTDWVPQTVVVRVESPAGQVLRIDSVRLRRSRGSQQ
jgi:general secretion pathway protein I